MAGIIAMRPKHTGAEWNATEMSDEDLLDQYLTSTEPDSEQAFRELVVRHGPMVLGICRHVLNQAQDAEDAFQATFLVLARNGSTIRDRRVLSGWLHEVAYRIAVRLRSRTVRRRAVERQGSAMLRPDSEPDDQGERAAWNELWPVLHEEVNRLPEKYRIPVILSYLEGKTNEEVANLLQWPVGTVKVRLMRARERLRSRLSRRGLALSAAFVVTALSRDQVFAEMVPSDLVRRTVKSAFISRDPLGAGDAPPAEMPPDLDLSAALAPMNSFLGRSTPVARVAVFVSLFLLLFCLSVAIGSSVTSISSGGNVPGFSSLRSFFDFRSHIPAEGAGASCH